MSPRWPRARSGWLWWHWAAGGAKRTIQSTTGSASLSMPKWAMWFPLARPWRRSMRQARRTRKRFTTRYKRRSRWSTSLLRLCRFYWGVSPQRIRSRLPDSELALCDDAVIQRGCLLGDAFPVVKPFDFGQRTPPPPGCLGLFEEELPRRPGNAARIVGVDRQPVFLMLDNLAQPANIAGNHVAAQRHRFQRHNAKRLVQAGENGRVHDLIKPVPLLVGDEVEKVDRMIDAQL